uniref:ABC transporter domain-containing protein n=1 Tax=Chenopodium quinoa TaxID=63459 RepID=A0A803L939_CHEQI
MKLNNKHSSVRTNILMMNPLPSISVAYRLLIQDEKQQQMTFQNEERAMAFAAAEGRNYTGNLGYNKNFRHKLVIGSDNNKFAAAQKKQLLFCEHCKIGGHTMSRCWKLHRYPPSFGNKGKVKKFAAIAQGEDDDDNVRHITADQYQQFLEYCKKSEVEQTEQHTANVAGTCLITCSNSKWIIDSGATDHICSNLEWFVDYSVFDKSVKTITIADGKKAEIKHIGDVKIGNGIILKNVLHVLGFQFNLISTHKLCKDLSCDIIFTHDKCMIQDHSQRFTPVLGKLDSGLYAVSDKVDIENKEFCMEKESEALVSVNDEVKLWHLRIGHLPFEKLHLVNKTLPTVGKNCDVLCQVCPRAKQARKSFPISVSKTSECFEIIHVDVMEISTHGRAGFATQANALFRKSLTYQKRNRTQNLCLLMTPLVIVVFFATVEHYMRTLTESSESLREMEVRNPVPWPPALKIPPEAQFFIPLSDWESSSEINKEVYKGNGANKQNKIDNNFGAALDFSDTNKANFNVTLWSEPSRAKSASSFNFSRLPRLVNMASNVYLQALQGSGTQILFEFMKEVPTTLRISALLAAVVDLLLRMTTFGLLLFPVTISFAFVIAALVPTVKTAQGKAIVLVEMFHGFALYRGVYEFQKYASFARSGAAVGIQWKNLNDPGNGLKTAMTIMMVEWKVMLLLAYYLDQVVSTGSGRTKSPLFFLHCLRRKPKFPQQNMQRYTSQLSSSNDHNDVAQERQKVEQLMQEGSTSHTAICDNIKKIYPGRDGNPAKAAVRGLSLALAKSECFGMLGPNGAGKTSFISMMIGLTDPTSGTAYIEGLDITTSMDDVYTCMGVCPQFDLLWETLTGREHLYFYGRLKNLKGSVLTRTVEEALKDVNLFHGGIADKRSGKYSGGMKRRLSVAISLIGDPKIVYLDEPSTGLDPASRNSLWNVVKHAKKNRTILLTTHSMEEAEALCDRLGVFVDGALRCLKARYGGYFIFTMTTVQGNDTEVEDMVLKLCNNANKTYYLGGTQKFELPKHEVRLADIFQLVEDAKSRFSVQAWTLADTTLEDVFIKVTRQAQAVSSDE